MLYGLYTDNNISTYASILKIWKEGNGFVPLNHKFPKERLLQIIKETGIDTVFCNASSVQKVSELAAFKIVTNDNLPYSPELDFNELPFDSDEIAYILFTSGSTGQPKGIPIQFKNIKALCDDLAFRFNLNSNDKVLQIFELSFDVSLACCFLAWQNGATLYPSPLDGIIPVDAINLILEEKINFIVIAPSTVNYLKRYRILEEVNLDFVTTTIFTGEALPWKYVEEWKKAAPNSKVYNAYGPTENTVWSTFYSISEDTPRHLVNGLVPIGLATKGMSTRINKVEGEENKLRGELWVSGPQVFAGYLNNESLTAKIMHLEDDKAWYKTGDLVERLNDGNLAYVNRIDNQVQVNGYRVEPGEVEFKIKSALGVNLCVVLPIQNENEPIWLLAVLENKEVNAEETKLLRELIPFYMLPRKFISVGSIPVNSNGKIDRRKLKHDFGS